MADLTVSSDVDSFMAAANAAAMRDVLVLGTIATQAASSVAITGGTLSGITSLTCTGLVLANSIRFEPQVYADMGSYAGLGQQIVVTDLELPQTLGLPLTGVGGGYYRALFVCNISGVWICLANLDSL